MNILYNFGQIMFILARLKTLFLENGKNILKCISLIFGHKPLVKNIQNMIHTKYELSEGQIKNV